MPTYVVTGPNGQKYRVNAPEGATQAEVMARVMGQARQPAKDTRPKSFWQGVVQGVAKPLNNAARLIEEGAEQIGIAEPLNRVGAALGMAPSVNAAERNQQRAFARAPNRPSGVGEFVGNVAGTLPTALLPGGAFVQGAASAGLLTNNREPDLIAAEMLAGGVLGKVGEKAVRGVSRAVAPKVSKAVRTMRRANVRLTPGQVTRESQTLPGRFMTAFEDRATSLPGPTGQLVRAGRQRSQEDFVRGAVNESLGELGQQLPRSVAPGNQAVDYAQKVVGSAYDDALRGMDLVPDEQLGIEISELVANAQNGGISAPHFNQFKSLVDNVVLRRAQANGGNLSGDSLKTVLSELGQKARKFGGSSVASEQEYGAAISALSDALEGAARRSSRPESVAALDAADRAYAKLVRVEGAARNASGGMFSPAQLETAVRQADSSVRKRAVAAGRGLMQDYATDARAVLPNAIGDSGTATRDAMWSLTPWMFDLAAYAPYRAAQALAPVMSREPGLAARGLGELLNRSAQPVARIAPVVAQSLLSER